VQSNEVFDFILYKELLYTMCMDICMYLVGNRLPNRLTFSSLTCLSKLAISNVLTCQKSAEESAHRRRLPTIKRSGKKERQIIVDFPLSLSYNLRHSALAQTNFGCSFNFFCVYPLAL